MNEDYVKETHVWRINKKLVVSDTLKMAIDIYCKYYQMDDSYIESIVHIDASGDYEALTTDDPELHKKADEIRARQQALDERMNKLLAEEAQP